MTPDADRQKLYDDAGVEPDANNPVVPYAAADLAPLVRLRTRDVLDYFRKHHDACVSGGWQPLGAAPPPPPPPPPGTDFARLWNDSFPTVKGPLVDEPRLAELLAWAISGAADEMPHGLVYGANPDDRFVQVEVQSGDAVD